MTPRPFGYLLVRVTGVVLAILVTGHFAVTHVVNDVATTDASFVATRWGSALWLTWDALLLACALAHAATGVWVATADYTTPRTRRPWRTALVTVTTAAFALGAVTLVVGASR